MTSAAARTITPADNQRPLLTEAELKTEFAFIEPKLQEIEAAGALVPTVFEDDEDLTAAKEMAPKVRGAIKALDTHRKDRQKSFDDAGDLVRAYFKALAKRMSDIQTRLENAGTVYLRKKDEAQKKAQRELESQQRAAQAKLAQQAHEQAAAGDVKAALSTQEASEAAGAAADRASALVDARPAERARTMTTAGTATLVEKYGYRIIDKTKVDVWKLQAYFLDSELNAAIKRAVDAGVRELAGVEIFPDHKARL